MPRKRRELKIGELCERPKPLSTAVIPKVLEAVVGIPEARGYDEIAEFRDRLRDSYRWDRRGRYIEACRSDMRKYAMEKLDGGRKIIDQLVSSMSNPQEPALQAFALKTLAELVSGKGDAAAASRIPLKENEKLSLSELVARAHERRERERAEIAQKIIPMQAAQ